MGVEVICNISSLLKPRTEDKQQRKNQQIAAGKKEKMGGEERKGRTEHEIVVSITLSDPLTAATKTEARVCLLTENRESL